MERESLYFTGPFETEIRPTRVEMSDDEVLVQTRVSGISAGTELLIYRGEAPTDLPADETFETIDGDLSFPLRYGYAAVGDVVAVGDAVDDAWLGRSVFAFDPHETRFSITPENLLPVPEDATPEAMALFPSVETATSLVLDGRPRIGEEVVVFGAGVVGLCTIGILSSFPLDRLVAVEPIPDRREHARSMGADVAVAPDRLDDVLDADVESRSDAPDGVDLAFELSGRPEALDDAVDAVGYDGRVVVGSWYGEKPATLDLGTSFHRDRISVESSQVSTLAPETRGRWTKDRRAATALDRLCELDVASLVTHRLPFADASEAYRLLDDRRDGVLQVLLTYR
ncbi:zinc-dependent alcohol dehydrogenase [Halobellus limi]|uniref:2-desacetyl-2-hydroxyethyl bacteriochlorophyllide A dehydrogenase n=1 Tax=Halobellus limi TaxID=699433 RepID=A0A1H6BFD7_9EURY|nr:zinc-binding alcohol dehydrogenase [Halobellus limi]QCC49308.1 oxidoreductase [Halobellus limi]SEG59007.1 2-desacetyl-2-hydroxyethyl bacteriochlorophyllide A dehydrogenase [Halobellus limi]